MFRLFATVAIAVAFATPSHAVFTECTVKKDTVTMNRGKVLNLLGI